MSTSSQTVPGLQYLSRGGQLPSREGAALVEHLGTFSSLLTLYLSSLHDAEFYGEMTTTSYLPFSHPELVSMVTVLRDVYVSLHMEKHLPHGYSAARLTRSPLSSRTVELKPSPAEYQQMKKVILSFFPLICMCDSSPTSSTAYCTKPLTLRAELHRFESHLRQSR